MVSHGILQFWDNKYIKKELYRTEHHLVLCLGNGFGFVTLCGYHKAMNHYQIGPIYNHKLADNAKVNAWLELPLCKNCIKQLEDLNIGINEYKAILK